MGLGRGAFRMREKSLIFLVLVTFAFVCFGAIFFLPDRSAFGAGEMLGADNRVYKVYRELGAAGQDLILPAPPHDDPNGLGGLGGGVIDRPSVRKTEDKARLLAQIEMDLELNEERRRKEQAGQVLAKPNLNPEPNKVKTSSSSERAAVVDPVAIPENVGKHSNDVSVGGGGGAKNQGGEDPDPDVQRKRDTVKAVSHSYSNICDLPTFSIKILSSKKILSTSIRKKKSCKYTA